MIDELEDVTFWGGFKPYMEKPVLANFFLGWSEGFGLTLVIGILSYWLATSGVDKTTVGLLSIISVTYMTKFLWAPFIDKVKLPILHNLFGQRTSWLILVQTIMAIAIVSLSVTSPGYNLSVDDERFDIEFGKLKIKKGVQFTEEDLWPLQLLITAQNNLTTEQKAFSLYPKLKPAGPITISSATLQENKPDVSLGDLSLTSNNSKDVTFEVIDNSNFYVKGIRLYSSENYNADYEEQSQIDVEIRATFSDKTTINDTIIVYISNVSEAIGDIAISSTFIPLNNSDGVTVGTIRVQTELLVVALIMLLIAFCSASQDVIIDAYRIEIMEPHQYGHGATALTLGYRAAGLAAGAGLLFTAGLVNWETALVFSPLYLLPGLIVMFWIGEPKSIQNLSTPIHESWFYNSVILPFKEFMSRDGWWVILLFILFFKLADATVTIMTPSFLVEMKFTLQEIAYANKTVGGVMIWVGVFAGSFLYAWAGLYRSLFITAILMMLTNLTFIWVTIAGNDTSVLAVAVAAENFASGIGNVTMVAFLSGLTNRKFTATQYALLSSIGNVGRTVAGGFSGLIATSTGWIDFFIISALAAIPSLLLLWYLWKRKLGVTVVDKTPM